MIELPSWLNPKKDYLSQTERAEYESLRIPVRPGTETEFSKENLRSWLLKIITEAPICQPRTECISLDFTLRPAEDSHLIPLIEQELFSILLDLTNGRVDGMEQIKPGILTLMDWDPAIPNVTAEDTFFRSEGNTVQVRGETILEHELAHFWAAQELFQGDDGYIRVSLFKAERDGGVQELIITHAAHRPEKFSQSWGLAKLIDYYFAPRHPSDSDISKTVAKHYEKTKKTKRTRLLGFIKKLRGKKENTALPDSYVITDSTRNQMLLYRNWFATRERDIPQTPFYSEQTERMRAVGHGSPPIKTHPGGFYFYD